MKNPSRRNRNIGTAKQGIGQDNELVVPSPALVMKSFYERLGEYKTVSRKINGHTFKFVIEKTRNHSFHACTIEDIERIIYQIPKDHYGDLELIVLRQPTRKEENLRSVWGRLIYSYEFENDYLPAIVMEAADLNRTLKWPKKLSIESQKELSRLKKDGHNFEIDKRFFKAKFEIRNIRSTQLYRTIPHEFGHYVHYLKIVKQPISDLKKRLDILDKQIADDDTSKTNPLFDQWDSLDNKYYKETQNIEEQYFSIPTSEKEAFAHNYADRLNEKLTLKGLIPFERLINEKELVKNGLDISDFKE